MVTKASLQKIDLPHIADLGNFLEIWCNSPRSQISCISHSWKTKTMRMNASSDGSLRCRLVPLHHSCSSLPVTLQLNLEKCVPRLLFPAEFPKGSIFADILLLININYNILNLLMVRILALRHLLYCSMSKALGFYLMVLVSLTVIGILSLWTMSATSFFFHGFPLLTALPFFTQG